VQDIVFIAGLPKGFIQAQLQAKLDLYIQNGRKRWIIICSVIAELKH
jgi:hypothetical protein